MNNNGTVKNLIKEYQALTPDEKREFNTGVLNPITTEAEEAAELEKISSFITIRVLLSYLICGRVKMVSG
jgi:hypothetical protein